MSEEKKIKLTTTPVGEYDASKWYIGEGLTSTSGAFLKIRTDQNELVKSVSSFTSIYMKNFESSYTLGKEAIEISNKLNESVLKMTESVINFTSIIPDLKGISPSKIYTSALENSNMFVGTSAIIDTSLISPVKITTDTSPLYKISDNISEKRSYGLFAGGVNMSNYMGGITNYGYDKGDQVVFLPKIEQDPIKIKDYATVKTPKEATQLQPPVVKKEVYYGGNQLKNVEQTNKTLAKVKDIVHAKASSGESVSILLNIHKGRLEHIEVTEKLDAEELELATKIGKEFVQYGSLEVTMNGGKAVKGTKTNNIRVDKQDYYGIQ